MQVSVAEFLEKVGKLKKTEEKIAALRANDSLVLRIILQGCYDPAVTWLLPEGIPPYKPNDLQDQEGVLIRECTKLRYYIKGFHDNLSQNKREIMFVQLLENLSPKDAELLCAIKEKKPVKGITLQHVVEALPGIFK